MRKALIPAVLTFALTVPSLAAEEKAKPAEGKPGETAKGGRPGTNVDMPYLMAPLTDADGKLTGYAYLSSRLTAMSEANALAVRDKLPFIQDAMVRDVNAEPVATADDPEKVDLAGVEKRLLSDADQGDGGRQGQADHHLHRPDRRTAPAADPGPLYPAGRGRGPWSAPQKSREIPLRKLTSGGKRAIFPGCLTAALLAVFARP